MLHPRDDIDNEAHSFQTIAGAVDKQMDEAVTGLRGPITFFVSFVHQV